jgi:hypothetical protein
MISLPAAVAAVLAVPAPVIFLDTCVLLDIVRAPHRDAPAEIEAATELLTSAQRNPAGVHLFVACPTATEWQEHIDEAQFDCDVAISCVDAIALAWSLLGGPVLPTLPVNATQLGDRLKVLSQDLLGAAMELHKDNEALQRATDRVIHSTLPARKGGKGAKDAIIMEHALQLTDALRTAGFNGVCVFASSNTSDFARKQSTKLHPDLLPAFGPPTNLSYAARLSLAVRELKSAGWVP